MNALTNTQAATRAHIAGLPLEALNPSDPTLVENDSVGLVFERLRREDPVQLTNGWSGLPILRAADKPPHGVMPRVQLTSAC